MHVCDVREPLLSVAEMVDTGNTCMFVSVYRRDGERRQESRTSTRDEGWRVHEDGRMGDAATQGRHPDIGSQGSSSLWLNCRARVHFVAVECFIGEKWETDGETMPAVVVKDGARWIDSMLCREVPSAHVV